LGACWSLLQAAPSCRTLCCTTAQRTCQCPDGCCQVCQAWQWCGKGAGAEEEAAGEHLGQRAWLLARSTRAGVCEGDRCCLKGNARPFRRVAHTAQGGGVNCRSVCCQHTYMCLSAFCLGSGLWLLLCSRRTPGLLFVGLDTVSGGLPVLPAADVWVHAREPMLVCLSRMPSRHRPWQQALYRGTSGTLLGAVCPE